MGILTVFAGPNGSGKSSVIRSGGFAGDGHLLEADAIALRMHPEQPQLAAIAAGREVLRRTQEYLSSGEDFAIETTLSGNWTRLAVSQARARGFFVRLVFICLGDPERCIRRVEERVERGGHHVPNEDVRRRYSRSLVNVRELLPMADESLLYDNSKLEPRLILEFRAGILTYRSDDLPAWALGFERSDLG